MRSPESICRENAEKAIRDLQSKLKKVTLLLEIICEHIESSPFVSFENIGSGNLKNWWDNQKNKKAEKLAIEQATKERLAAIEKEKQERKVIRERVISKLTPEERKILGI